MSNLSSNTIKKSDNKINTFTKGVVKDFKLNKELYIMIIPVIVFYIIFHYKPMAGIVIAFKNFKPSRGLWDSPWIGFKHFYDFFSSVYFWRILKNTIVINLTDLLWGFPAPIILALLINELKNKYFKSTVQTITYLPHFISLVVVCGMIKDFTSDSGIISYIITLFGGESKNLLQHPQYFVPVFVVSGIWQHIGWGTIVYLAALTGISQELYEAAEVDGANKWRQTISITIPGIAPTIIILLILRIGQLLSVGFEKIILLYNPAIYETADVISSFVYRKGLLESNFSYSAAVGLFNSLINFVLLISSNKLSKKFNETSLW
jgi:putative aldouronate transport system permease protein